MHYDGDETRSSNRKEGKSLTLSLKLIVCYRWWLDYKRLDWIVCA